MERSGFCRVLERESRRLFTVVAGTVLLAAWTGMASEEPPFPSDSVTIFDLDGSRVDISLEAMQAMPRVVEEKCICVGETSGFVGVFDYGGVRLCEVLKKAVAAQKSSGYRKENLYLLFKGTDQYQVVASWNELFQSADGRSAMIVLEKDGKPLPPEEGAFRLYFPGDKFVGRSVKCLSEIEIKCAEGVVEKKKKEEQG